MHAKHDNDTRSQAAATLVRRSLGGRSPHTNQPTDPPPPDCSNVEYDDDMSSMLEESQEPSDSAPSSPRGRQRSSSPFLPSSGSGGSGRASGPAAAATATAAAMGPTGSSR